MHPERNTPKARIERHDLPGLKAVSVVRPRYKEHFISAVPSASGGATAMFLKVADFVRADRARIVAQDSFGIPYQNGETLEPLVDALDGARWPVTWLEPGSLAATGDTAARVSGTVVWAVSGMKVEALERDGQLIGMIYEDDLAEYCRLAGLLPEDLTASRASQAREVLESMEKALHSIGWNFHDVVRTWFHNHDILGWYDEFNRTRNTFFKERGVFDRLVPASTGVGGINPAGAALVGATFAMRKKSDAVQVIALPSPLQCPALEYGSSFSRAVEISRPDLRWILVSGTASIAPEGPTAHVGNINGQITLTMEVVRAIFRSRGLGFADTSRSIAYFKHPEFAPAFDCYATDQNLPPIPVIPSHSTVCRDDLLFEIEMDALKAL
ncbi:MAG: RidA family protein [Planctomycetota bacterium]